MCALSFTHACNLVVIYQNLSHQHGTTTDNRCTGVFLHRQLPCTVQRCTGQSTPFHGVFSSIYQPSFLLSKIDPKYDPRSAHWTPRNFAGRLLLRRLFRGSYNITRHASRRSKRTKVILSKQCGSIGTHTQQICISCFKTSPNRFHLKVRCSSPQWQHFIPNSMQRR